MKKILILPRYSRLGASSRYRFYNYANRLEQDGFDCEIEPLFSEFYLEATYSGSTRMHEVVKCYFRRFWLLFKVRKFDLCLIEKELFPFIPFFFEWLFLSRCKNYIVDYDDAIFHRYDSHSNWIVKRTLSNKIAKIMNRASVVIAGNEYIGTYAKSNATANVSIIPTVIDIDKYDSFSVKKNERFTIVWIGSQSTVHYIKEIKEAITNVCNKTNGIFIVIGAKIDIPGVNIKLVDWSESTEIKYLKSSHVGIMPLSGTNWDKGKCGFKIIQYMASGLPAVASPVGVNSKIIQHGINGYLASSLDEWEECLLSIHSNGDKVSSCGHETAREQYSLEYAYPLLLDVIKDSTFSANIDLDTVEGFGREWSHFTNDISRSDLLAIWRDYFSIFPWERLPDGGGIGADIGCGTGRWSEFVADKTEKLYLIDPSAKALEVAKSKMEGFNNVAFINKNLEEAMQEVEELDFAFSLGVLHHIPDIESAFDSISSKLKKGAPFLVYLYYSLDNRPAWYRGIWTISDFLRKFISRAPYIIKLPITQLMAFFIYLPIARFGKLLMRMNINLKKYPLIYYSDKSFYFMRNDALDRFGTSLENRFSKKEIMKLFEKSGFTDVRFSTSEPYWCACGIKK